MRIDLLENQQYCIKACKPKKKTIYDFFFAQRGRKYNLRDRAKVSSESPARQKQYITILARESRFSSRVTFTFGKSLFTMPQLKVPLSLPARKRECGIFGPGMMKNRINNMGIKRDTPQHMFARLHVLWTGQLFTSLVV